MLANVQKKSTDVFVFFYFLLIFALILANAYSVISSNNEPYSNALRVVAHVLPLTCLITLYFINNQILYAGFFLNIYFGLRVFVSSILIFLMLISGLSNEVDASSFAKMAVLILHIINFTVVLPASAYYVSSEQAIYKLSISYCWLILFVSLFVVYEFSEGRGYGRLGYPYIPGVYAYMCLVGFAVSTSILRSNLMTALFLTLIFMSGSRSALVLSILIYLMYMFSSLSIERLLTLLFFALIVLLSMVYLDDFSRPYLVERVDVSSGRFEIWSEAAQQILQSPFTGYYNSITFAVGENETGLAAHNSFIDLCLRYGVIFALLSYIYWFVYPFRSVGKRTSSILYTFVLSLYVLVSAKSLVTNIFWTNMGDGATYFVFVMVTLVALRSTVEIKGYVQGSQ